MKNWIFIIIPILIFSCKKAEDRACIKAAGDQTSLEIPLEQFNRIHVGAKMAINLIQSSENKMVIHGRKNVLNFIKHEIKSDGFLHLTNENKCNFLRKTSKNEIQIDVYFVNLYEILFEGTRNLTTATPIVTSEMKLLIRDGGATVYLDVDCNELHVNQGHGYGDFVISGKCTNANLKINSNGFGNTKNLAVSSNLIVINNTPVASEINTQGANTTIEINGSGDVNYIGNPGNLTVSRFGSGNAVKID